MNVSIKAKLKSSLTGDTIKLYVGPEGKQYSVHKALLTQYEWFRKIIFPDGNEIASQESISLLAESPKAFELLIVWLYRKTLKAISTIDPKVGMKEVLLYFHLYCRADVWKMDELQNALMDRLRARRSREYELFSPKLIKTIYENTQSHSPLRSYFIDSFIFEGIGMSDDPDVEDPIKGSFIGTRKDALAAQLAAGNHAFILDCYEALFQLCAKSKIRDPDRRTGCAYHRHVGGLPQVCGGGKMPVVGGEGGEGTVDSKRGNRSRYPLRKLW